MANGEYGTVVRFMRALGGVRYALIQSDDGTKAKAKLHRRLNLVVGQRVAYHKKAIPRGYALAVQVVLLEGKAYSSSHKLRFGVKHKPITKKLSAKKKTPKGIQYLGGTKNMPKKKRSFRRDE